MIKKLFIALAAFALTGLFAATPAFAQASVNAGPAIIVCNTLTVTASNAYGTNYVFGGKQEFVNAFTSARRGVLLSVSLQIKKVETSGFTFTPFTSDTANSVGADAAAAAINAADVFKARPSVSLTASSVLGTHTTYGATGVGMVINSATTSLFGVFTTNATLTNQMSATTDAQACVGILQDP